MNKLIIKNIGPLKSVAVSLAKYNLFIGPQSSGKSCILKIASYCNWVEKRIEFIHSLYKDEPRIQVLSYDTLTIAFAKKVKANFILRGLRSVRDFEYERDIADLNKQSTGIETILLFTEHQYGCISSSAIRELISYGEDVTQYLPKPQTK